MAKKKSSKTREERAENPVAEAEKKLSSAKKKPSDEIDEIDEIFASKKKKKTEKGGKKEDSKDLSAKPKQMKRQRKKDDKDASFSLTEPSSSGPRKKTGDGLTIYTEEELGLNKTDAGGTGQCPFDCSCCF